MSSIQSTQNFQQTVIAELAALRAENSEMKVMLKELTAQPPASAAPKKRGPKKAAEPSDDADAEPPVKRAPSAYIVFSSKRVQPLVRAAEAELDKSAKSSVGTMNQFAGKLWAQTKESGKEWSDEEIMAEWDSFEAPAVSKQAAAGKGKKSPAPSVGEGEGGEPEADAAAVEKVKKARKPQSEETKKAAAAKRAATKAKKAAEAAGGAEDLGEVEEAADAEADIQPAAPPAPVAAAKPAPKKAAFVPKPKKALDLALDAWEFEGNSDYLKNERGDVLNGTTGEWVGHWDGAKLDTSAPEPADFETLAVRE
jgi:hypothetical protein